MLLVALSKTVCVVAVNICINEPVSLELIVNVVVGATTVIVPPPLAFSLPDAIEPLAVTVSVPVPVYSIKKVFEASNAHCCTSIAALPAVSTIIAVWFPVNVTDVKLAPPPSASSSA